MARLHEKGYITDPVGKAKSVVFVALHVKPDKIPELKRETFTA
jgi:hypothetical protein